MSRSRGIAAAVVPALLAICVTALAGEPIYTKPAGTVTRWSSFENPGGKPGAGGKENKGAKGHAFDKVKPGQTRTLMEAEGPGRINRMWFTIDDRSTPTLRSLRLDMYWDGAKTPAVSVPFGDFFGAMLEQPPTFENEFFSSPEAKSFNCCIPMPFRQGARVTVTNESTRTLRMLFYDIDYVLGPSPEPEPLYFHAIWRRENPTALGKDFSILPKLEGSGRFLGTHIGVAGDRRYPGWWGEGEVKVYLDGDLDFPTLCGTGTEDYIGTGWGQKQFFTRYQGCSLADEKRSLFSFYRFHVPDPVYFDREIRVTIQQMGGDVKSSVVKALREKRAPMQVVTVTADTTAPASSGLVPGVPPEKIQTHELLLDQPQPVDLGKHPSPDDSWWNYYRQDDVCATTYFYLDRPENGLPPLAPVAERTAEPVPATARE